MFYRRSFWFKFCTIFTCSTATILGILFYNHFYTKPYLTIKEVRDKYDYIVVGAGTAGCVLASKLSKTPGKTVLLVEAGGEFNFISKVPLLAPLLQGTKNDWAYKSIPQKFSSFGLYNQRQFLPRGKGLGGTNQINYMVHSDDIIDLENWVKYNFTNLPLLYESFFKYALSISRSNSKLSTLLFEAWKEINSTKITYIPGKNAIKDGQRWSSYDSHLKLTERTNLHIIAHTNVTKILFNNKTARGIEIIDAYGNKKPIRVKNEIILSAGVFNTPQILINSGLGPSYGLKRLKIPQIVDLPGVGKNLHDHLNIPLYVSIEKPISVTMNKVLSFSEMYNYLVYKKGLLSESPNAGYIKQSNVSVLLFGMGSTDEDIFRQIANIKPHVFKSLFPYYKNNSHEGFVLLSTCLKPLSRGYVSINNSDFETLPFINPQYLLKREDVNCMIEAVKLAIELINTNVFKNIGAKIHWPMFNRCSKYVKMKVEFLNNDYLECVIRTAGLTAYHSGGTCRIGIKDDRLAVIDSSLRVKGVKKLRIVDASVLPEPLSTFPNSVLIALAEYASKIILNEANY